MSDPLDTLSKLFDTLKDASNRNEKSTDKLIDQQIKLIGEIKNMPVSDIKQALKDHVDQTATDKKDVDTYKTEIMDMLKVILGRINKMMTVFALVVSITVGSYVIIRYLADDQTRIESLKKELQEEREKEQQALIDEIKKEMEKLHQQQDIMNEGAAP